MPARTAAADLLTTDEAADYLRMSPGTLRVYRHYSKGPSYTRTASGTVRYRRSDLDAFMADIETATTQYAKAAVAVTDALGKINGADLDAFMALLRTRAADDKPERPAMSVLWDRLAKMALLEYARRERPLPPKPAKTAKSVTGSEGPSPYL